MTASHSLPRILPRILGITTALPDNRFDQIRAIHALRHWLGQADPPPELSIEKAVQVFENAGVAQRQSVIPIEDLLTERTFGDKNRLYITHAQTLGHTAVQGVLATCDIDPSEVDLFITTSCTGFMIPALDACLLNQFGFRSDVKRLPITELGCAAGVAALRVANDFIQAYPGATVLILAVELATVTFQPTDTSADHIVSTAIFGDGAAAMLVSDRPGGGLSIQHTATHFFPGTQAFMGFDVEATGFHIFLSPRIPAFVRRDLMPVIGSFLDEHGGPGTIDAWLIHPGGPKILDAIEDTLCLNRDSLTESRSVLRNVGNLSSATIFFVIDAYLRSARHRPGSRQAVVAVGPGFQADFALLEWSHGAGA